eukprot:TRINITY_DN6939_c0_g1_i1.p1 TRINITY_DN6939_c0_g1~~TRINITY_DN6939_c0_g1_i1.p1  ORF type:complete len:253 (+),score=49.29 TRINITY_DN6939_c0_g1_i1:306-1064(+)
MAQSQSYHAQYAIAFASAVDLFRPLLFRQRGYSSDATSLEKVQQIDDRLKLLCRFLTVKHAHADISPPLAVDQDWHTVLLCTKQYRQLCETAFGSTVDHSLLDAFDFTEPQKQLRRLLFLQSHEKLFGNDALHDKLIDAVNATGQGSSLTTRKSAKRDVVYATLADKRAKANEASRRITLTFLDNEGEVHISTAMDAHFERLARAYAKLRGAKRADLSFTVDGAPLIPDARVEKMGLEDGDNIDVGRRQLGC